MQAENLKIFQAVLLTAKNFFNPIIKNSSSTLPPKNNPCINNSKEIIVENRNISKWLTLTTQLWGAGKWLAAGSEWHGEPAIVNKWTARSQAPKQRGPQKRQTRGGKYGLKGTKRLVWQSPS